VKELAAYKITIVPQNFTTFFEVSNPSVPNINPHILTTADWKDASDTDTFGILKLLDLAMKPASSGVSAVASFAMDLLRELKYLQIRRRWAFTAKYDIPLVIRGKEKRALVDVCIIDEQDIVPLLIQEVKGKQDPDAPLVAKAIAAFTHNRTCMEAIGLPPPSSAVIAGITLKGTMPTFYKIPISMELATAVRQGVSPESPTTVYVHVPDIPGSLSEGMRPLGNRSVILSCFEAFKKFIK